MDVEGSRASPETAMACLEELDSLLAWVGI
jgi:hypothetical protein